MKKIKILCIFIMILGIAMFTLTYFFIPATSSIFPWCTGLASALIILGLGYLINTLLLLSDHNKNYNNKSNQNNSIELKEKAGYLVCKIMNILLCVYILILNELQVESIVLFLTIALVLFQYVLDLCLQLYFTNRKDSRI